MLTLVAQGIADRGLTVAIPDLFGTGDSDGDFRDATWAGWLDDLRVVYTDLKANGHRPSAVLAVRTGCALAADVISSERWTIDRTVFWQPMLDGERFLKQFLRLRVAASLMSDGGRESVSELRSRLRVGESLEVAGYFISPTLADELERIASRISLETGLGVLDWFEIVRDASQALSSSSLKHVEEAKGNRLDVHVATIAGEPFWSSVEIIENQALILKSLEALEPM